MQKPEVTICPDCNRVVAPEKLKSTDTHAIQTMIMSPDKYEVVKAPCAGCIERSIES